MARDFIESATTPAVKRSVVVKDVKGRNAYELTAEDGLVKVRAMRVRPGSIHFTHLAAAVEELRDRWPREEMAGPDTPLSPQSPDRPDPTQEQRY